MMKKVLLFFMSLVLIVTLAGCGESSQSQTDTTDKMVAISGNVGDVVVFGKYEQDNDTSNGMEEIEWRVLAKENDKMLLISKYALDSQPYNETHENVTWETCTLRKWLNNTFYNTAFSDDEKEMISLTSVVAEKNPSYNSNPGSNTEDNVFLLSISEVNQYFETDLDISCKPTKYAHAKGSTVSNGFAFWVLRTPGQLNTRISYVDANSHCVNEEGSSVDNYGGGHAIRPAIWVKTSDDSEQSGTTNPTKETTEDLKSKLLKANIDDVISFGTYEQDFDSYDGVEDIEWIVLAKEDNRILVISQYVLDCMPFSNTSESTTWATSTIRNWLNSEFYNAAFSDEEQELIEHSFVSADPNPTYGTDSGVDTEDNVFLLSVNEINKYFVPETKRMCTSTEYAHQRGSYNTSSAANWWTRTSGYNSKYASYVRGNILQGDGEHVDEEKGVRPAMWINIQ